MSDSSYHFPATAVRVQDTEPNEVISRDHRTVDEEAVPLQKSKGARNKANMKHPLRKHGVYLEPGDLSKRAGIMGRETQEELSKDLRTHPAKTAIKSGIAGAAAGAGGQLLSNSLRGKTGGIGRRSLQAAGTAAAVGGVARALKNRRDRKEIAKTQSKAYRNHLMNRADNRDTDPYDAADAKKRESIKRQARVDATKAMV
jgi:hypothetical protein